MKNLKISFYIVKINSKNFLEIYIYEEYPTIVKTIEMVYYLYYWKENEINDKKNIDQGGKKQLGRDFWLSMFVVFVFMLISFDIFVSGTWLFIFCEVMNKSSYRWKKRV